MKNKSFTLLILPLITLILEALPFGAVCNFANPEGAPFRETFSYFSLVPFGYANFFPLITAVLTLFIIGILIVYLIAKKRSTLVFAEFITWICFAVSLCPLWFGFSFFSVTGLFISITLLFEALFLQRFTAKKWQVKLY